MADWWNDAYLFRRPIYLYAPQDVPADHPVTIDLKTILTDNIKTREDFDDVEVLFLDGEDWVILPRDVYSEDDETKVRFKLAERFVIPSGFTSENSTTLALYMPVKYYLYYGNSSLDDSPRGTVDDYVEDLWPLTVYPSEGKISYTQPGDHWIDGETSTQNARAVFRVGAERFRINSEKGPNLGQMYVSVTGTQPVIVDLSSSAPGEEVVYSVETPSKAISELSIKSMSNNSINISSIDYSMNIKSLVPNEEFRTSLRWSTFSGGVQ